MLPLRNKTLLVYSALVLTTLIYSGWHLIAKMVMSSGAPPAVFAFYRCLGGASVLLCALKLVPGLGPIPNLGVFVVPDKEYGQLTLAKDDVYRFLVLGCLMATIVVCCCFASLQLSPITLAMFQPTIPVVATVASSIWGIEEITTHKAAGICCSVAGAMSVVALAEDNATGDTCLGVAALIVGVVAMAMYFVLLKAVVTNYPPVFCTMTAYMLAAVLLFPVALFCCGMDTDSWSLYGSPVSWAGLAYAVCFCTAFNYSILGWANKETTPRVVTSFTTLQPITTAVLSWYMLDVHLTRAHAAGGMAIILGLLLNIRAYTLEEAKLESKRLLAEVPSRKLISA